MSAGFDSVGLTMPDIIGVISAGIRNAAVSTFLLPLWHVLDAHVVQKFQLKLDLDIY